MIPLFDELLSFLELHSKDVDAFSAALGAGRVRIHMVQDSAHSPQGVPFAYRAESAVRTEFVAALKAQRLVHGFLQARNPSRVVTRPVCCDIFSV